jgi:hypothetical protein
MDADSSNKKLFYKLIQKQRKSNSSSTNELFVDGVLYNTDDTITTGWRSHFEKLATPKSENRFEEWYKNQTELDTLLIEDTFINAQTQEPLHFDYTEVGKAIDGLNNGKAPDIYGLTAEHLKNGSIQ